MPVNGGNGKQKRPTLSGGKNKEEKEKKKKKNNRDSDQY